MKKIITILTATVILIFAALNLYYYIKIPSDFGFELSYGVSGRNKINTFEGYLQKDTVEGPKRASIKLSKRDMLKIYNKMKELNVMSYDFQLVTDRRRNITPSSYQELKVSYSNQDRAITWGSQNFPIELFDKAFKEGLSITDYIAKYYTDDPKYTDVYKLQELGLFIINIIESSKEFRGLPKIRLYV